MKPISYINHKIKPSSMIDTNYLFIDGMSRSGKSSIAPVISSFKRVEHYKDRSTYERFLMMYESGDLSKQGFKPPNRKTNRQLSQRTMPEPSQPRHRRSATTTKRP